MDTGLLLVLVRHPVRAGSRSKARREASIIAEERKSGMVAGRYFASETDVSCVRRFERERRVSAAARRSRTCAWCSKPIVLGETFMEIASRNLHDPKYTNEFAQWAYEGESRVHHAVKVAESNDPRWSLVTDDTLVDFDGEMSRWGDLMLQDRQTVDMLEDGRLVGGYPF